jgi:WD40-like Beta Propeller Repeat
VSRAIVVLAGVLAILAVVSASAHAALVHEFRESTTIELEHGVPSGCATAQPEPPCIAGPLSGVSALTADSEHHLWVAERIQAGKNAGKSRVDSFDDQSGKFLPPQLQEEGGVGELDSGVAVGYPGGEREVYVGAGQALAVFGPNGKLQHAWTGAHTPNQAFGTIRDVAVSGNLQTQNEVFVATFGGAKASENVVDVFAPGAGGEEPAAVLGQIAVPQTACVSGQEGCVNPLTGEGCNPEEAGCTLLIELHGVAVSPFNGDVFVSQGLEEKCGVGAFECVIDVFEPAGVAGIYNFAFAIKGAPGRPFKRIGPMAVDGKGDIYVVEKEANVLEQFDAEGQFLGQLRGTPHGPFKSLHGIAADPSSANLYVGDYDRVQQTGAVDVFGPNLIVPDVSTTGGEVQVKLGPAGEGELEATLTGTVNPLSQGPATCAFAWGASRALGQLAKCNQEVPEGNAPTPVQGTIKVGEGLSPDSSYFFRLQASNKNGVNPGEESQDRELHTPGPGIHSTSASEVSATSATLNATIDPNGSPTSYYFQYGHSSAYEAQTAPVPLGAGKGDIGVNRHVQGLAPLSEYHYRVVAVATLEVQGKEQSVSFFGADQSFRTLGAEAQTLDSRRWELVSPSDKHGAQLFGISAEGVIQAAAGGGAVSYVATQPTEEGVKGYLYGGVQVLSTRGQEGWSSKDIPLAHASATGVQVGTGLEYRGFSSDLCSALVEAQGAGEFTPLAGEAFPPDTQLTPYVRHNCTSVPSERFEPLLTSAPGYADVAAEGAAFRTNGASKEGFVGSSADLTHVILSSNVALTGQTAENTEELYEWSGDKAPGERLSLVSVLPSGAAGEHAQLGFQNTIARHAVSEDGARVVWSDSVSQHLYLRDTAKGQSVQLDTPEAQCLAKEECGEEGSSAKFQLASADGSRVLFTDAQRLTANAGRTPGQADLYQCEIEEGAGGKPACRLSDLTPAPGPGQGADVQGALLGASEDGSWVYFAANGALGPGASAGDCIREKGEGQCNLYVSHEGQTRLIARVSGADQPDWSPANGDFSKQTARVSPDGRWLAFMSRRPLSGYDNEDVTSKAPGERMDEEVFLYHAGEGGAGRLICASCDPSGARPVGMEYGTIITLVGGFEVWPQKMWIAANVPGGTPYERGRARYQSRYLSNSGRLFFNSNDALLDQDINKNQDVYEFEPAGPGCSSASPGFIASRGGCLGLISSGRAAGESAFLDASESGEDAFFLTAERLAPNKDRDGAFDVYDAHVCSGASPCPEELAQAPACASAEACRAASTPQPGIFGAPASATFSGLGNVSGPAPSAPAHLSAKQKLAKALSACRHKYKKQRKRRLGCERKARKRYATKSKKASGKGKRK